MITIVSVWFLQTGGQVSTSHTIWPNICAYLLWYDIEKVLGGNIKLIEVLHDDTPGSQADGEKLFILRKVGGGGSRSSSRESPRLYSSKVAPEQQRTHGSKTIARKKVDLKNLVPAAHPAAITVPIVDVKIEAALRRLDQALVSLVKRDKQDGPDQKNMIPAMAVARNSDQGVDIFMQRGILCSKPLSRNQIQYSLLAFVDGGNSKRQLVTQKVLQSNAIPSVSRGNVSEADMVTIVEYGKSFLEAQEKKNGRKGAATNGTPAFLLSSDILDSSGEQASSLEDLDKVNVSSCWLSRKRHSIVVYIFSKGISTYHCCACFLNKQHLSPLYNANLLTTNYIIPSAFLIVSVSPPVSRPSPCAILVQTFNKTHTNFLLPKRIKKQNMKHRMPTARCKQRKT